jgi:cytochrome c oxidase assembly factor 2
MAADGTLKRTKRRKCVNTEGLVKGGSLGANQLDKNSLDDGEIPEEQMNDKRSRRECPIPKPGGKVGELLGFKKEQSASVAGTESSRSS